MCPKDDAGAVWSGSALFAQTCLSKNRNITVLWWRHWGLHCKLDSPIWWGLETYPLSCGPGEKLSLKVVIWASSWDYGAYHIGDQWRLRRACAVLPEPLLFAHIKYGSTKTKGPTKTLAPLDGCTCLKNEFMEDKKCHNLMRWLICHCAS